MTRAEINTNFLRELRQRVKKLAGLFDPAKEEKDWSELLNEVG